MKIIVINLLAMMIFLTSCNCPRKRSAEIRTEPPSITVIEPVKAIKI